MGSCPSASLLLTCSSSCSCPLWPWRPPPPCPSTAVTPLPSPTSTTPPVTVLLPPFPTRTWGSPPSLTSMTLREIPTSVVDMLVPTQQDSVSTSRELQCPVPSNSTRLSHTNKGLYIKTQP